MPSAKNESLMDHATSRFGQSSATDRPHEDSARAQDRQAKRRDRELNRKKSLDEALDAGLEGSFPGSDPVAVTQPPHSALDKNGS